MPTQDHHQPPHRDQSRDHAQLVILSLLDRGPLYGYAIAKQVALRSDNQLRLTPGVLYPALRALEADGLITATWETIRSDRHAPAPDESGEPSEGRRRKWYRISAKGRRRLAQRLAAHRAWQAILEVFIARPDGHGDGPRPGDDHDSREVES